MGYTTEFFGRFEFNRPVDEWFEKFINDFSDTRHMKMNNDKIISVYPDYKKRCFMGSLGKEGEYFLNTSSSSVIFGAYLGFTGLIVDINVPPKTQPGLWCNWIINDKKYMEWNGAEKFYDYVEWLQYLIDNFIKPCMYSISGEVRWQGEDDGDHGIIKVTDNKITIL